MSSRAGGDLYEKLLQAPLVLSKPEDYSFIPEHIKEAVIKSRLEALENGDYERCLASIGDLVVHLMDASMKYPLSAEYVRIYAYYANILFNDLLRKSELDIPKELTPYEKELADKLRRDILLTQLKILGLKKEQICKEQ